MERRRSGTARPGSAAVAIPGGVQGRGTCSTQGRSSPNRSPQPPHRPKSEHGARTAARTRTPLPRGRAAVTWRLALPPPLGAAPRSRAGCGNGGGGRFSRGPSAAAQHEAGVGARPAGFGRCRCGAARAEARRVRAGCWAPRSAVSRRSGRGTGGSPAGSGRARIRRKPRGRLGRKLENCRPRTFFCLALSAESNSRRFVLRSALFFFFFFFCLLRWAVSVLLYFSPRLPFSCAWGTGRIGAGSRGARPVGAEAGAPLPRGLSGRAGRHRSACGTRRAFLPSCFPARGRQRAALLHG